MRATPIILLVLAGLLIWTAILGNTGTLLSAIFTPHNLKLTE